MLAPESEVLPGQVSCRLFGGLKAGEVRCVTCICTCMQQAQLLLLPLSAQKPLVALHSSISASKLFPNRSMPVVPFAKALGETMWYGWVGVCVCACMRMCVCVCVGAKGHFGCSGS